jgi:preprotein translocase subunit SecY
MFEKIKEIYRSPDLRNKILFILFVFFIFRLTAAIKIPGVDISRLKEFFLQNDILGFIGLFTGGNFDNLSPMMLGLGPYITALIIMQLLTMIFPRLKEMYQLEGEAGRQKFNQYSRLLTVPLSALQAFGLITLLTKQNILKPLTLTELVLNLITITAGTLFLMWLGELISNKGLGNGVSLLIFAGIIANIPSAVGKALVEVYDLTAKSFDTAKIIEYLIFIIVAVLIIAGVAFITESTRQISVNFAKRIRGRRMYGGATSYLPLKVNQAGVIPIIFALSILLFPSLIASFFPQSVLAQSINAYLHPNGYLYSILYFLLVFAFTYFYTQITFDPSSIAENLQKSGGFITGIRPGKETTAYLSYVLNRITLAGALFLGVIAVLPSLMPLISGSRNLIFGGTAVLIVVSVVLETIKQVEAHLAMRTYD